MKNKILPALMFLSLAACSNSGSSSDQPVTIPKKLDLQKDTAAPLSDRDFETAKTSLLKLDASSGGDFELDNSLFCSRPRTALTPEQQKLVTDIKAICNFHKEESNLDGPVTVGATKDLTSTISITDKAGSPACPVTESVKTTGSFKIISLDQKTLSMTSRGHAHVDSHRSAISSEAANVLGLEQLELTSDAELSMSIENDSPLNKYTRLSSSGFIKPVAKALMALDLRAEVLQPSSGQNELSLSFSLKDLGSDPKGQQILTVSLLAHWTGTQAPVVDQMILGGHKLSADDIAKVQSTGTMRNLMRSMQLIDDCGDN